MDKRIEFRVMNTRKLETYVDMAGMTIYRDVRNKITDITYVDYSFGDPREAWREREELFRPDPDEVRLPDKTCDRYFYDYWMACGGPYRHMKMADDGLTVEQIAEAKAKTEKYIHDRKEERRREIEREKRREERARANAERIKVEQEKERMIAEKARLSKQRDDSLPKKMQKPPIVVSSAPGRKSGDIPYPDQTESDRRERQADAMRKNWDFSAPQYGGVVTWADPRITDVRLVRLVLGTTSANREMTTEEQADYWYWKTRGK